MLDPVSSNARLPLTGITPDQMRMILEVSRAMTVTTELEPLLKRIAEATCSMLDCERASIFLHDPKTDELWSKVALGSGEIRVPSGSGIVGHAFKTNAVVHVPEAYVDARFLPEFDKRSGFVTRNLLAAPMVDWDERPVGVVQALNKIGAIFDETDAALLRLLANQAGVALQRWKLQQTAILSTGIRHEMELAKRLQEGMIPKVPPTIPGLTCAGWTRAASINGGDCYDLWKLPDGSLGVLVADASGHGLPAALVISQVRALVRTLSETDNDPLRILQRVNSRLRQDLERGRFVTAFLGFINASGDLRWCSAGQAPIIFHEGQNIRWLDANLPPLSVDDLSGEGSNAASLAPGDMLILLSDGITEAFNLAGELLGSQRLHQSLQSTADSSPAGIVNAMRDTAIKWQEKDEPADDQTVVVVQRNA